MKNRIVKDKLTIKKLRDLVQSDKLDRTAIGYDSVGRMYSERSSKMERITNRILDFVNTYLTGFGGRGWVVGI